MTITPGSGVADMMRGLRAGDTPEAVAWPKSLWLILPARPSRAQTDSIGILRQLRQEESDLSVNEVRVSLVKGRDGKPFSLLQPNDVAGLYRGLHRSRAAVIALCGAKILLDISELPSNRGCMTVERFTRYKCYYALITRPEEVSRTFPEALRWMNNVSCEGPRDPRCYPAAVFETDREYQLDSPEERQTFVDSHKKSKKSSDLTDAKGRTWQVGPMHTRDLLQVAGCTLPIGFHWDVQASGGSVIATGWERWYLPGHGHTNVHPDAFIRGGNATKTHPVARAKSASSEPRTPRHKRQRGAK